jgi:hypothetical protein
VVVNPVGCKIPTVGIGRTGALWLGCMLLLAGCGQQHGSTALLPGATPSTAPNNPSSAQSSLSVRVLSAGGLTAMTRAARHDASRAYRTPLGGRRTLSVAIQSVVVTGTVFPSYAGAQAVTSAATQNTTSIPSSTTLTFNNVPVGNNEWVVADVVGYDQPNGAGSHVDLGELAGFVNVSSSPSSVAIDTGSTRRLQVGVSGMLQGILSSYDIKNETTLDADLGAVISSAAADPNTGLFSAAQMSSFMSTLYQTYNRTLSISTGSTNPALATLVYNSSDGSEKNYAYNAIQTNALNANFAQLGTQSPTAGNVSLRVVGNPFSGVLQSLLHTPSATPSPAAVEVHAEGVAAPTGSVQIQHVYGGGLIVGMKGTVAADIATGAFTGGLQTLVGRAPGDSSTVTVGLQPSKITMTMQDPQAAAFVGAPYYQMSPATTQAYLLDCNYSNSTDCRYGGSAISGVVGTAVTMVFDSFNPFGLPAASFQVCTGLDCFPLVNGATNAVRYPFYDGGNSLSFYGWAPVAGSAVTAISQPLSGGYALDYSGSSGAIQSATPAYFHPQQDIQVLSDAPAGTTWTATITCSGQVLQNTGVQQGGGFADIYVLNVASVTQCSPINIRFTLPAGSDLAGTLTISGLGIPPARRF